MPCLWPARQTQQRCYAERYGGSASWQCSGARCACYAITGDYVGFPARHQRLATPITKRPGSSPVASSLWMRSILGRCYRGCACLGRLGRLCRRGSTCRGRRVGRSLRQRHRTVRQSVQEVDHVGALLLPRQTGKCHGRPGDIATRVGQEFVKFVEGPLAALGLHGGGEVEAATAFATLIADDIPEIRPDTVGAALLEGVAGLALLGGRLALFDRRRSQQILDRLLRRLGRGAFVAALFLGRDCVTGLGRFLGGKNSTGSDIEGQRDQ